VPNPLPASAAQWAWHLLVHEYFFKLNVSPFFFGVKTPLQLLTISTDFKDRYQCMLPSPPSIFGAADSFNKKFDPSIHRSKHLQSLASTHLSYSPFQYIEK
jgi:hypothetical protein